MLVALLVWKEVGTDAWGEAQNGGSDQWKSYSNGIYFKHKRKSVFFKNDFLQKATARTDSTHFAHTYRRYLTTMCVQYRYREL